MRNSRKYPGGFTLVEMMIALFVGSLLIMISYNVLTSQKKAADAQNQFINAQQNARVALETLERELRLAGLNIDDFNGQPIFIDAAPYQVIYNSDISTGVAGVPGMNINQNVPVSTGGTYMIGTFPGENLGTLQSYNNNAETIRFTLDRDDNGLVDNNDRYVETNNPHDYALYREENGWKKDIIAYGIRGRDNYPDGQFPEPVFKYFGDFNNNGIVVLWGDGNNDGILSQSEIATLSPVPQNLLDKILEVEISIEGESALLQAGYSGPHSSPGNPRVYRSIVLTSKVRARNVGTGSANLHACEDPPISPTSLNAVDTPNDNGRCVTLAFNGSYDELAGEEDVISYSVYRRLDGDHSWECVGSLVPKAVSSYTYLDDESSLAGGPEPFQAYYYYVTAWDCRPQESNPSNVAGPVTPNPDGPLPPVILDAFDTPCDAIDEITVVLQKSSDDQASGGTVSQYEIFRGVAKGGGTLSKTLIGRINADGSDYYKYLDNPTNNLSGVPPAAGDNYYYMALAVGAAGDTVESIPSNEYGAVYYSGTISSCKLTSVTDYPDDEGEALVVSWNKSVSEDCVPSDVWGYILRRKAIFDPDWIDIYSVVSTGSPTYTHLDEGLMRGAEYNYCVITVGFGGEKVPSNEMSAIPLRNTELDPPENLMAEDILCDATGSINVTFENAPQDIPLNGRVTHYNIYRRGDLGAYSKIGNMPADGSETYLFVDGPVSNPTSPPVVGEFYHYQATAFDQDHDRESAPSNEGYTMSDGEPGAPRITDARDTPSDAGNSITVIFDRSADDGHCTNNVIVYRVYRETVNTGFSHVVGEITAVGAVSYTFYDDNLFSLDPPVDGIGYYYVVRAIETGGEESVNSNVYGPVFSISQDPSSYIVFDDDFETDKGWDSYLVRTQDDWQRGAPAGNGGTDRGNHDPSTAHSGSNVYGNDIGVDGWNGDYQNNVESYLVSPLLDCSGHNNLVLQFQRWLNVEEPAYDQATIHISTEGRNGPWTQIWQNDSEITDNSWIFMEIDISQWADGESEVALRWGLKTDGGLVYAGWNIDDVLVREKAAMP
ncbi:MAG: choice-of-anchor J domain-containing protein [Candidatus Krumholzibacteriota bacterium]|nr:choice-of-anchor J domain-containing protein [Candidatus Krumholzibacteriota bacterium]